MRLVHNVTVSVFSRTAEEKNAIHKVLISLIPDEDPSKISIREEIAEAYDETSIFIYSMKLHRQRIIRRFLETLFDNLSSEDLQRIYDERELRVDDEGCLYIRLDKASLKDGSFEMTDSGDCFHIRIKLAAYPKNKENAMEALGTLYQSFQ